MLVVLVSAGIGALAGPFLHHVAVAAGSDGSFHPGDARCRRCSASHGRMLARCRACGLGIGRAIATSLLLALVCAGFAWQLGPAAVLPAYLLAAAMTVVLFITDVDHKRIPNRITYPGTPLAGAALTVGAFVDGTAAHLGRALAGAVAYAGVLLVVYVVARGGFGFGDVKLAVPLGLFLAFLGWDRLVVAGFATAFLGGLVAIFALLAGRAGAKTEIPYGPPMIVGAWLSIIGGEALKRFVL